MAHDEFDLYDTIIKDTSELSSRRRQLDGLYVTLITFILTGEAYLAFYTYSHSLDNWVLASAAVATSLVGLIVTTRWRDGQRNIGKILRHRYQFLRKLERTETLQRLGATVFTEEWEQIYGSNDNPWFHSVTVGLQVTFALIFVLIPIPFIIATASHSIPALRSLISPL